jgi:hypothetical protein
MKPAPIDPYPVPGMTVVAVARLLWAVFDSDQTAADAALGHIECDGTRFRVGLAGDELEPYSFATLRECATWFAEYRDALSLGRSGIDGPRTPGPSRVAV